MPDVIGHVTHSRGPLVWLSNTFPTKSIRQLFTEQQKFANFKIYIFIKLPKLATSRKTMSHIRASLAVPRKIGSNELPSPKSMRWYLRRRSAGGTNVLYKHIAARRRSMSTAYLGQRPSTENSRVRLLFISYNAYTYSNRALFRTSKDYFNRYDLWIQFTLIYY